MPRWAARRIRRLSTERDFTQRTLYSKVYSGARRMRDEAVFAQAGSGRTVSAQAAGEGIGRGRVAGESTGVRPFGSAPAVSVGPLLVAALMLGVTGDALLRAGGPPGLNMSLWVAAIALAAFVLQRRAASTLDRERVAWLAIAVLFAAGLAWRDSTLLKLLALGCTTLCFALAAYRVAAAWVRRAGVSAYAGAWGTGALHAWTAAALVLVDAARSAPRPDTSSHSLESCGRRGTRPRDRDAARRGVRRLVHVGGCRVRRARAERRAHRRRADREPLLFCFSCPRGSRPATCADS